MISHPFDISPHHSGTRPPVIKYFLSRASSRVQMKLTPTQYTTGNFNGTLPYVRMYIHMYIYIYIYTYTHIYTCICMCIYAYTYT